MRCTIAVHAAAALITCVALAACGGSERGADSATNVTETTAEPTQRLDRARVPADLAHLVPLAERWGIGDDVQRVARVDRATAAERQALRTALAPHHVRITAWLDSFGQGAMTDEAAAFMYMQLALEEMGPGATR